MPVVLPHSEATARRRRANRVSIESNRKEAEMPNSAPGFASRPDHRVDLLPAGRRVTVKFGGVTIADSSEALQVEETGHGPVYYLPEKDVRLDLMRPTEHHTRCPYKGEACYWTIGVPTEARSPRRAEN